MRFNLLGPLTVDDAMGRALPLRSVKQRTALASLLLQPNEKLTNADLIVAMWGDEPPISATANLRTHVLGLRRLLDEPDAPPRIQAKAGGYLLRVGPQERDLDLFDLAVVRGRTHLASGNPATAQAELQEAVGLWRGDPLADVPPSPLIAGKVAGLEERRLLAEEDLAEALLRSGAVAEAVRLLRTLLERNPLRQRAWEHVMLGLYHLGDVSGALDSYRVARHSLIEQLGLEPGPRLQRLHEDILHRRDPAGTAVQVAPPAGPVIHDLPPSVAPFTGRTAEKAAILQELHGSTGSVVALHGTGGVGKSALAVHVAHAVAADFPDGVLYLDLRGTAFDGVPVRPLDAIARLLRALGVPNGAVPIDEAEAAAAYRRHTAHRRLLLVLDNAHTAAQVAALLPTGPGAATIVTSRRHLATLPRGHHLCIEVLPEAEAMDLLGRAGAGHRVAADPVGAQRLARLCGYLPLALRIAAARMASRPAWPLRAFADRLADPARRLDELSYDDIGVRRTLRLGYEALSEGGPHEQRCAHAFGLIGGAPLTIVSVGAMAALLSEEPEQAHDVLETLADHRLLEPRQPGRYELHDLLRILAREVSHATVSANENEAALHRLMETYIAAAERAIALDNDSMKPRGLLRGPAGPWQTWPETAADVTGWLDTEHLNMAATVRRASEIGGELAHRAVRLGWLSYALCWRPGYSAEAPALTDHPLARTAAADLATDHAVTFFYRASLRRVRGDLIGAEAELLAGIDMARRLGDHRYLSNCHDALACLHYLRGDPLQALRCHDLALELRRRHGTPLQAAGSLSNMADARFDAGQQELALAGVREALSVAHRIGSTALEGAALAMLGQLECRLGEVTAAEANLTVAIERTGAIFDLPTRCEATLARCAARLASGQAAEALGDAVAARELAVRMGDRYLRAISGKAMAMATFATGGEQESRRLAGEAEADLLRLKGFRSPMYAALFGA
ncbi:AfsR/SARP family transcriptional regulator [Catelliglobosispora koreensis]|uniref:AfsR/SARP family transcriptional regulator n=1 Tax=Catelliglobosispora koreensis TaxID=129052 RepID=UPI000370FC1B|nr:AfsR/SARP family transcriptional regulator [Catelliglobosispora koreensis]